MGEGVRDGDVGEEGRERRLGCRGEGLGRVHGLESRKIERVKGRERGKETRIHTIKQVLKILVYNECIC